MARICRIAAAAVVSAVSMLVLSRLWNISAIGRPAASCNNQPVAFSAT
jgi:hypothetical protein